MITTPSDTSLLATLRRETAEAHRYLEESSRLQYLLSPSLSQDSYIDILRRFHLLLYGFESSARDREEWREIGFDFEQRMKTPLLERDLGYFGIDPHTRPVVSGATPAFRCERFVDVLGTMYVTEGSSLGGQVISRQLRKNLGLDKDWGATYFNGYGGDTGHRWKECCELLERYADRPSERDAIVSSARHAFEAFTEVMR